MKQVTFTQTDESKVVTNTQARLYKEMKIIEIEEETANSPPVDAEADQIQSENAGEVNKNPLPQ